MKKITSVYLEETDLLAAKKRNINLSLIFERVLHELITQEKPNIRQLREECDKLLETIYKKRKLLLEIENRLLEKRLEQLQEDEMRKKSDEWLIIIKQINAIMDRYEDFESGWAAVSDLIEQLKQLGYPHTDKESWRKTRMLR